MKYVKKTKPAIWREAFPAQASRLRPEKASSGGQKVRGGPPRKRGWRFRDPLNVLKRVLSAEKRLYHAEAAAFVQAAIARGETCPVVAAVPELRNGVKYGHPISAKLNEVHHKRGRGYGGRGPLLRDQRFWMAISRQGHRWVHANQNKARELGFLCAKGEWNVPA